MNARTREEEYLRRMKALGYEPDLRGMDDDDIEWELSKMEESDRRREVQLQPQQQPLRTIYRPVDPGLKARILRQFGQPYDESAIPKGQEFYLNGWDNGEDEVTPQVKSLVPQGREKKSDITAPDFDPWKNAWKLDWGKDGNILAEPRTPDYPMKQDDTIFSGQEKPYTPLSYTQGVNDASTGIKALSMSTARGNTEKEPEVAKAKGNYAVPIQVAEEAIKELNPSKEFGDEVEKAALAQGDSPELARKKGQEAAGMHFAYTMGVLGGSIAVTKTVGKDPGSTKGLAAGAGVSVAGTYAGSLMVKPWIKKQVLGKTEDDYNKPLFPGTTPPGPG
jgi:hypothetical protein